MSFASGVPFGELLSVYGPRDLATLEELIIERHKGGAPKLKAGEFRFD